MTTEHSIADITDATLFKASFSSVSSLVALQLFSRLFTFILNQALFRMASPKAFGTAAIQFELFLSTILFLSREGVRNTLLRVRASDKTTARTNLALLPLILGIPLAVIVAAGYSRLAGYETRSQPGFELSVGIYALAAVVELLSEPMHIRAMAELKTGIRVKAEGLGITGKAVLAVVVLLFDERNLGGRGELALLAFAVGQLMYAFCVLATYSSHYGMVSFWLTEVTQSGRYFEPEMFRLSLTMTSQSLVKHFLTEGDKLILSRLSPLQDQGGYAIAVNYGSLVARIVFQPIEEVSRVFFSKILAESPGDIPELRQQALLQASVTLVSLLALQLSFAVVLWVFGSAYMSIALYILLPPQYLTTSAPQVLSAWIWYIPVLAVNGGLEAFLSSVATTKDLNRQSRWMAAFSIIYISAALTLYGVGFGDISLIYANIINLSARITYSIVFISSYFKAKGAGSLMKWQDVWPTWEVLLASVVSATSIWYCDRVLGATEMVRIHGRFALLTYPIVIHVGLGGILALACAVTWWITSGRSLTLPWHIKRE